MQVGHQMKIRVPEDIRAFLAAQAERNGCSQNSEIIRAIRDRMDRQSQSASEGGATPPKASPET